MDDVEVRMLAYTGVLGRWSSSLGVGTYHIHEFHEQTGEGEMTNFV